MRPDEHYLSIVLSFYARVTANPARVPILVAQYLM